jgi:serine protease AprX
MLLAPFFAVTALADNATNQASNGVISTTLASKIATTQSTDKIGIIVILKDQACIASGNAAIKLCQSGVVTLLTDAQAQGKVQEIKQISVVNAVAAQVTPDVITSISQRSDVAKVELDSVAHIAVTPDPVKIIAPSNVAATTIAWGVSKINAPAVWQQGITGKGVTVAVVDTGVDATHPDLSHMPSSTDPKVVGWIDYVNSQASPYDDHGHGTHVCGTISGIGTNGIQTGVAPGTKLMVAKVFDSSGNGATSNMLLAFDWAIANHANIISMSAGSTVHSDSMTLATNNIISQGIVPVFAGGNYGPAASTIICPGDEQNAIAAGATDSNNAIASFSSHGPVTLGGLTYIKPDVSAPGVDITSTYPLAKVPTGYASMSGTSMATPHISGTVALMLEAKPTLTPAQVSQVLQSTALDLGTAGKDNIFGAGLIDAAKAVTAVLPTPPPTPAPSYNILKVVVDVNGIPASTVTKAGDKIDYSIKITNTGNMGLTNVVTSDPLITNLGGPSGDTNTNAILDTGEVWTYTGSYTVTANDISTNGGGSGFINNTANVKCDQLVAQTSSALTQIVLPVPPTLKVNDFTATPISGTQPLKVSFTSSVSGTPTRWTWAFESARNTQNFNVGTATHTYSNTGKYNVILTVRDAAGHTSSLTKQNYITVNRAIRPTANFVVTPSSAKIGTTLQFTDKSTNSPTSWQWNFGDNSRTSTDTRQNPTHAYTRAGSYTVTLAASNVAGYSTKTVRNCASVTRN